MDDGYGRHTPVLSGEIITRAISFDVALLPHLGDALNGLANAWQWVEIEDTVDAVVQAVADAVDTWYSDMNIGMVANFLGSLPSGWLALDGSLHDADDYPELFDVLDSQFKDVGENEFTLPDMAGLFGVSAGGGLGLGDTGGANTVALSVAELPAHTHGYTFPVLGAMLVGVGAPLPTVNAVTPSTPTSSAGSGDAHDNLPPYFVVVTGIFAGRV